MVVLDTSIVIDHLRQKPGHTTQLLRIVESHSLRSLAISVVSIQELYRGESTRDAHKEDLMLTTIASLQVLPYTYEIALLAGKIGRDVKRSIEFADAAIAATAIMHNASLSTLNKKDFSLVPELELLS